MPHLFVSIPPWKIKGRPWKKKYNPGKKNLRVSPPLTPGKKKKYPGKEI